VELLLVGQSLPVMRLVSVSGESGVCPGCSTVKQHGVLLMGFKNQDSLSNLESEASFWIFFIAGDGGGPGCGSDGPRWQRALVAPIIYLMCNFIFLQGYRVRGLVVSVQYQ
jgi:hypothetical protein